MPSKIYLKSILGLFIFPAYTNENGILSFKLLKTTSFLLKEWDAKYTEMIEQFKKLRKKKAQAEEYAKQLEEMGKK